MSSVRAFTFKYVMALGSLFYYDVVLFLAYKVSEERRVLI